MQVLFLFAFFSIAGVKEQDRGREVWLTKIKRRGKAYFTGGHTDDKRGTN